jgi:hypothetical protein
MQPERPRTAAGRALLDSEPCDWPEGVDLTADVLAIEAEAVEGLRAVADRWDKSANLIAERALVGDPAAALAAANTLRECASQLRAAIES